MSDADLVLFGADEVAFWQAAYLVVFKVLAPQTTDDATDAAEAARAADAAVRELRRRVPNSLGGGPELAGIDPPKDALHEPCCCGGAETCANAVVLPDGTLRDCCARCGGLLPAE